MRLLAKKLDSLKKITILFTVTFLAIMGLFYFIFLPVHNEIKGSTQQIQLEKTALEEKLLTGQNNIQLQKKMKQIASRKDLLDAIFLKRDEEIALIDNLENLAKNNYLDVKIDLSTSKKTDKKNYYILPLLVRGTGNYDNIINFLQELEKADYFISLDSLEIGSREQINTPENMQTAFGRKIDFTIYAKTYWK